MGLLVLLVVHHYCDQSRKQEMIFFILAVLDKLPYDFDVWDWILAEVLLEVALAVFVYAAWSAGKI